jgi:hypothetical protein
MALPIPTISAADLARLLARAWSARPPRAEPDHRSIAERRSLHYTLGAARYYFYGAVAPSYSCARQPDPGQVLRAVECRHARAVDCRDEREGYERTKEVGRGSVAGWATPLPGVAWW